MLKHRQFEHSVFIVQRPAPWRWECSPAPTPRVPGSRHGPGAETRRSPPVATWNGMEFFPGIWIKETKTLQIDDIFYFIDLENIIYTPCISFYNPTSPRFDHSFVRKKTAATCFLSELGTPTSVTRPGQKREFWEYIQRYLHIYTHTYIYIYRHMKIYNYGIYIPLAPECLPEARCCQATIETIHKAHREDRTWRLEKLGDASETERWYGETSIHVM